MADYIDRQALYEKAATLEAQALDYVGKLIEQDVDETSTEWRIWSAILTERTAFKYDVYDAPSADVQPVRHGKWIEEPNCMYRCSSCGSHYPSIKGYMDYCYCPSCGARM